MSRGRSFSMGGGGGGFRDRHRLAILTQKVILYVKINDFWLIKNFD